MDRPLIKVGVALLVLAFLSMVGVAVVATLEGSGGASVVHQSSGRPTSFFPVAALVGALPILGALAVYLFRRVRRRPKHQ